MRYLAMPLLFAAGCVDTSTDRVKLTAEVGSASASIEQALLVTQLGGGFELTLARGDFAEGDSTIEAPPAVVVVAAETGAELLPVDAVADPPLPWVIEPDSELSIRFTLSDENVLSDGERDAICAGEVAYVGSLRDADDRDAPLGFESRAMTVGGCP